MVNAGGPAIGPFSGDTSFTGGTVNQAGAPPISSESSDDAAPPALYQSERYGNFTYTASLAPNSPYTVRLHFAEIWWTSAGKRSFNVSINGVQVLTGFDVFAAAGGKNVPLVETFNTTSDSAGVVRITFTSLIDNAQVNGIEVVPGAVAILRRPC